MKAKGGSMQNNKNLFTVAITGGIGSGKSTATQYIKSLGYTVIDSDEIVKKLYKKRRILGKIKNIFPSHVKGKIFLKVDKAGIAKEVFSSNQKHEELTGLLTPMVLKEILKKAKNEKGIVFAEVPLLFERNYQKEFDKVFVIRRSLEKRIDGVIERSKLKREQVEERIKYQTDYENFDFSPYVQIINDGDKESFYDRINKELEKLKNACE